MNGKEIAAEALEKILEGKSTCWEEDYFTFFNSQFRIFGLDKNSKATKLWNDLSIAYQDLRETIDEACELHNMDFDDFRP